MKAVARTSTIELGDSTSGRLGLSNDCGPPGLNDVNSLSCEAVGSRASKEMAAMHLQRFWGMGRAISGGLRHEQQRPPHAAQEAAP